MMVGRTGAKKRQVIANSNRTMFMWVAGMSAVIGICAVLAIFLAQQLIFRTKVTSRLDNTLSVVNDNNKKSSQLMDNLRARSTDAGLNVVKANPGDQALQPILDALPSERNALALGSSLQQKLLVGVDGVTIESLTVDPSQSVSDSTQSEPQDAEEGVQQIDVAFVVSASKPDSLRDLLVRLEHSLRIIDIDTLSIQVSDAKYTMSVSAHAYYQPVQQLELGSVTCLPDKGKC